RAKRDDLRDYIRATAEKTGDYFGEEAEQGRWAYDVENNEVRWQGGPPLDPVKQVDGYSSWVRKSDNERARYVIGSVGEDIHGRTDYAGLQVEKGGVIGAVKWGTAMRMTQDVWESGEKMLNGYRRSEPRPLDIRKS